MTDEDGVPVCECPHAHALCDDECHLPAPLWGPDGPAKGQVVELRDMPGTFVRWTGSYWEMA
jgi:hypothetical protein